MPSAVLERDVAPDGGGPTDPGDWTTAELVRAVLRIERDTKERFGILGEEAGRRFDDLARQLRELDVPTRTEHAEHTRRLELLERERATKPELATVVEAVRDLQEANRWSTRFAIASLVGVLATLVSSVLGRI